MFIYSYLYVHWIIAYIRLSVLPLHILGWHGAVFVRHGVYIEGVFKFDILIPQNFPYGNCPVRILIY